MRPWLWTLYRAVQLLLALTVTRSVAAGIVSLARVTIPPRFLPLVRNHKGINLLTRQFGHTAQDTLKARVYQEWIKVAQLDKRGILNAAERDAFPIAQPGHIVDAAVQRLFLPVHASKTKDR
jgi:hypothetical protein